MPTTTAKSLLCSFLLITTMTAVNAQTYPLANNAYQNQIAHFYHLKNPNKLTLLNIKGYQQTTPYTCGPAAVMALLHYYGKLNDKQMTHETELQISKEMGASPDVGTNPQQIVTWLEHHGFEAKSSENGTLSMLQKNAKNGIPTLVEWIDWGGHWVAVAGYHKLGKNPEEDHDTILFADPNAHFDNVKSINGITTFNPDRFNSMWFDAQYFNPGHIVKGIYIIATPKHSH